MTIRNEASPGVGSDGIAPLPDRPWDAVVVGAGPAGALTAHEMGRLGIHVLLVDRLSFPRWKVCGATLSPGARELLSRFGLGSLLPELGARELRTLRLGGWSVGAELALHGSVAVSRSALDVALVQAATETGVTFLPGARARLGPLLEDRRILEVSTGEERLAVEARVVVAADGLGSGLMAQAGVPSVPPAGARRPLIGVGATLPPSTPGFEDGAIHMAVGEAGYVGLVRVEDGSLNVAAALSPGGLREAGDPGTLVGKLLEGARWPSLPDDPTEGWRGTPELTRGPSTPGAPRLFAVGDAAGYVEPFTGEGMFWAMAGALALAPLAARGAEDWHPSLLAEWTRAHRRAIGRAQRRCRMVAWTLARPGLSRWLVRLLSAHPRLANPLVRRIGAPTPSVA